MHSKSDYTEFMIYGEADKLYKKFFNHFFLGIKLDWKHQWDIVVFIFGCVHLLYYKCHKINPNCGGSYINSPYWIKNETAIIDQINNKLINSFNTQYFLSTLSRKIHKE